MQRDAIRGAMKKLFYVDMTEPLISNCPKWISIS